MEDQEIESEIHDYLHSAIEFSNNSIAAMAFCRHAIECVAHNKFYREFGKYPMRNDTGQYPGLASVISKLNNHINKQDSEIMFSVNAQTRGGLHWNNPTAKMKLKKHHVMIVVEQIVIVCKDVLNIEIVLSKKKIEREQLLKVTSKTLSQLISEKGLSWQNMDSDNLAASRSKLEEIIQIAMQYDKIKGLRFDDWLILDIADCAITVGKYKIAKKMLKETHKAFREIGNKVGEACVMNIQARIANIEGSRGESEKLLKLCLNILDEEKDYSRYAIVINNCGNNALIRGDLHEAERCFSQCISLLSEEDYYETTQLLQRAKMGLASVRCGERRFSDALSILYPILKAEEKSTNRDNALFAGVSSNIGHICQQLGDLDNHMVISGQIPGNRLAGKIALSSMSPEDAVKYLIRELKHQHPNAEVAENIKRESGDSYYLAAEKFFRKSLVGYREIGDPSKIAQVLLLLAHLLLKIGPTRWSESESLNREFVRISNEKEFFLNQWYKLNGFTESSASWDYPPHPSKWLM